VQHQHAIRGSTSDMPAANNAGNTMIADMDTPFTAS
jgi:hypothetical protein